MITLDAVRTALSAADPYTRMDELVRAEMAAGHKVKEIVEQFKPVVDNALETQGLSEDSEEALLGTLDALMGSCRADQRYVDPPNTSLPTEAEITKLPRWARVAFAARCARRVQPLYGTNTPPPIPRYIEAISRAIRLAESCAAQASVEPIEFTTAVSDAYSARVGTSDPSYSVARAAMNAADCPPKPAEAAEIVRQAVDAANQAVSAVTSIASDLRRDFDQLLNLALTDRWHASTPVPPEVFGPLWPEGPPKGWPVDPDARKHTDIAMETVTGDGLEERIVEDEVVNLFNAMNHYHIARGGQPLSLEDFQPLISALVPAGV